jgi:hypothetical protein
MRGSSFASRVAILLAMLLALACGIVAILNYLKFEKLLVSQQSRVIEIIAADAAEAFERGINLGVRLQGVPGGQALLERALSRDPDLRRLSVVDARGRILFDTDRGRIGSETAPALLPPATASGAPRAWRASAQALAWIGVPIVNGFGQAEGALLVGHARTSVSARLDAIALAMLRPTLLVLAVAVPFVVAMTFLLARPVRRYFDSFGRTIAREEPEPGPLDPTLAALHAGLADTERLLAEAEQELEELVSLVPEGTR